MPFTLTFADRLRYLPQQSGIPIPVVLAVGNSAVECLAKIDTGAEYRLFQRAYADRLGLLLDTGHRRVLDTLTGHLTVWGHEVTLQTYHLSYNTIVYFAEDYSIRRNLLGRRGWLQQVRLAIIDHDEELYLSSYDDQH